MLARRLAGGRSSPRRSTPSGPAGKATSSSWWTTRTTPWRAPPPTPTSASARCWRCRYIPWLRCDWLPCREYSHPRAAIGSLNSRRCRRRRPCCRATTWTWCCGWMPTPLWWTTSGTWPASRCAPPGPPPRPQAATPSPRVDGQKDLRL
eukprot:1194830-Prorocentrum_minimum.AAC.1